MFPFQTTDLKRDVANKCVVMARSSNSPSDLIGLLHCWTVAGTNADVVVIRSVCLLGRCVFSYLFPLIHVLEEIISNKNFSIDEKVVNMKELTEKNG